jgi:organic hydroperoxide reductase OsmC/OhrA
MDTHVYQTSVKLTADRRAVLAADGLPSLEVATPPEFPGGHSGIWSPEHLYTAAAEACLMTTFLAIAANSKLAFESYASSAEGTLEKTGSGFLMTRITLRPKVVVADATQVERARRILEKAEKLCLISNSMKTQVELVPEVSAARPR